MAARQRRQPRLEIDNYGDVEGVCSVSFDVMMMTILLCLCLSSTSHLSLPHSIPDHKTPG